MRRRSNGLVVLAAMVATAGTLASCGVWVQEARFKETRQLQVDHVPGSAIDVETRNGAVAVRSGEADGVWIDATIKAVSAERLEATEILASRADGGELVLRVAWPGGQRRSSEGASFDITLPDVDGVRVKTGNGLIRLERTAGHAELRTSNGRIEAEGHAGSLQGRTSNGKVLLRGVDGEIDVDTSNGRIEIEGAGGPVGAETSNGRMVVRLREDGRGPLRLSSSNGAIEVLLPARFAGSLDADTSNGSVNLEALPADAIASTGRNSASLRFGEGEQSRIRTSNGSITIRAREASTPVATPGEADGG